MKLLVNGTQRSLAAGATIADLVSELSLEPSAVAVERNREIVPRIAYDETPLADGDAVEIVTIVGGG